MRENKGSSDVSDAKIHDWVIVETGSRVWVRLGTFDESREPIWASFSRVPQVPR